MRGVLAITLALGAVAHASAPNPLPESSFTEKRLTNGVTVLVRRVPSPQVAASLWVEGGSAWGPDGAAHALEHMLFKGSDGTASGEVDSIAEAAGGQVIANTYRDAARYRSVFPAEGLEPTLKALAKLVRRPLARDEDWQTERRLILEELSRPEADRVASARNVVSAGLLSPSHPVAGTVEGLRRLTPADIRAFHQATYRPEHMTLVVVGEVSADAVFSAAERTLGGLPRPSAPSSGGPTQVLGKTPVGASSTWGGRVELATAYPAAGAQPEAAEVLARALKGRLDAALAGKADRAEAIYSGGVASMLLLVTIGPPGSADAMRDALHSVAAGANKVTAAEVSAAIRDLSWSWWLGAESPSAQADAIGRAAAQGGWKEATGYTARLGAVTAADVRAAARQVFGDKVERTIP